MITNNKAISRATKALNILPIPNRTNKINATANTLVIMPNARFITKGYHK
jgi:hypothetical protein